MCPVLQLRFQEAGGNLVALSRLASGRPRSAAAAGGGAVGATGKQAEARFGQRMLWLREVGGRRFPAMFTAASRCAALKLALCRAAMKGGTERNNV